MAAERIKKNPISKPKRPTELQQKIIDIKESHPSLNKVEIAAVAGCDHAHVIRTLQTYGLTQENVKSYITNRAIILAGMQQRLISSITDEDIKKTPVGSRILAAAQLFDKEKAELGQSTEKQPVLVLVRGDNCQVSINGQSGAIPDDSPKADDSSLHNMALDITPPAKCAK